MIGQSFAIIAVILVMAFMFLRSGRRAGALFTLPLISVCVFHLLGYAMQKVFTASVFSTSGLHVATDLGGLLIGAFLCFKLSRAITVKRIRYVYFISCVIFMSALTILYINLHI